MVVNRMNIAEEARQRVRARLAVNNVLSLQVSPRVADMQCVCVCVCNDCRYWSPGKEGGVGSRSWGGKDGRRQACAQANESRTQRARTPEREREREGGGGGQEVSMRVR